jgi:hypothetical protein
MDGTSVPHDQCPMATAVHTGKPVYGIEAIGERPDGRRVPCAVYPAPMFDESGKVVGGINMLVDISERKAIEERQSILIREMDHHIRNNLAKIEAIMGSTIRASTSLRQFEQAVLGRIGALAKTNSLLTQHPQDSVSLRRLLDNELEMYRDGEGARITCLGPEIAVPPHVAVPWGWPYTSLRRMRPSTVPYLGPEARFPFNGSKLPTGLTFVGARKTCRRLRSHPKLDLARSS